MNKKGFTLIELISIIVILSLIALIVFPAVTSIIKSSRNSAYESQITILEKAAKQYYLDRPNELPDENSSDESIIDIYDLVANNYIIEEDLTDIGDLEEEPEAFKEKHPGVNKVIINPKNKKPLEGHIEVKYQSNQYIYKFVLDNWK